VLQVGIIMCSDSDLPTKKLLCVHSTLSLPGYSAFELPKFSLFLLGAFAAGSQTRSPKIVLNNNSCPSVLLPVAFMQLQVGIIMGSDSTFPP
jgi:hypothetical protein